MRLAPAKSLSLFHTIPRRAAPSMTRLFVAKFLRLNFSLSALPDVCLYPSAMESDAARRRFRVMT